MEERERQARTEAARLMTLARRLLPAPEEATEAVRQALAGGEPRSSLERERAVVRACFRRLHARNGDARVIDDLLPRFDAAGRFQPPPGTEGDAGALGNISRDRLRQTAAAIPADHGAVLALEGLPGGGVVRAALLLELPLGVARLRLHRARQALLAGLERAAPGPAEIWQAAEKTTGARAGNLR